MPVAFDPRIKTFPMLDAHAEVAHGDHKVFPHGVCAEVLPQERAVMIAGGDAYFEALNAAFYGGPVRPKMLIFLGLCERQGTAVKIIKISVNHHQIHVLGDVLQECTEGFGPPKIPRLGVAAPEVYIADDGKARDGWKVLHSTEGKGRKGGNYTRETRWTDPMA